MKLSGGMVVNGEIERVCWEEVVTYFNPSDQSLLQHSPRGIKEEL
jgi:hypothetical protein